MTKLIWILLLLSWGCKWIFRRWPWQILGEMMALKPHDSAHHSGTPATTRARILLGVNAYASREEIIAAHKALLVKIHPDRGGSDALVYEANDARDVLLGELRVRG